MDPNQLTEEQLMAGLRKADAAGDTVAAKRFAQLIQEKRQAPAPAEVPGSQQGYDYYAGKIENPTGRDDVIQATKNFPGSVWNVGKEMVGAVRNYDETIPAMLELGKSAVNKFGRNYANLNTGYHTPPEPGSEDAADAMIDYYKGRYGSLDSARQTAVDDPAGAMMDASIFLSPGRALTKNTAIQSGIKSVDPISATVRAGQSALKLIPEDAAYNLYDKTAKFPHNGRFDRAAAIRTAVDEGILPTPGGIRKVENRIEILGATLDDMIAEAGRNGAKIPVGEVERYINQLIREKGGFRKGRRADVERIKELLDEWHADLADLGGGARVSRVSPEFVQTFKRSLDRDINYNKPNPNSAARPVDEDFDKALRRGAKDAIADAVPEVSEINKLLSELENLQPALKQASARIGRNNVMGLDTSAKTGAGAFVGNTMGQPALGAGVGFAMSMLGSPAIRPRIAIYLKRLRDGDVAYLERNIGDPAARAALVLAANARDVLDAPSYAEQSQSQDQR